MKLLRLFPFAVFGLLAVLMVTSSGQEKKGSAAAGKQKPREEKASLADDKVLGKVVDAQGITSIRPPLFDRWTPACVNLPLKPGDWLRTDVRGANALQVRMTDKSGLILGPGSLVELVNLGEVRASSGELEVQAAEGQTLIVHGPGDQKQEVKGAKVLRVQNERLVVLAKEPKWLLGFKGAIVNEALGSLVAKVDGRDVPLTVGDHKVRVDIRDQIARTTIEESFVNHTDGTLEGVFYFPLPADASISGFGMWIGDQLIEADVVEKQRAREIYETILRERRDPGLLEWSGGNLFKARVFPIFPNSDKRIKITYTQVLPLRGSSFRYSYALQSEMLKEHPLRELKIDVHVYSSLPLKDVSSATHSVRKTQTKNSAQVEFSAQEYTPERDFEVAIDVERQGQEVIFVPHQRGSDGYFMLMINPPGGGAWERAVIANSEPLDIIVLADTSGSMDRTLREAQDQFIAALLGSLGPKDTFRLAACDVDCQWVSEVPQAANEKGVAAARDFLGKRRSLGWTDLDAAFKSVIERAKANTHVIYIGDGIITTGDADPADFANRLKQMYAGQGTFHAVAPGSTYERVVLQTIASLGGGSVRRIAAGATSSAADGPSSVARDLLNEIAQPAIRDLAIEFHGLRTARAYPERLPNLPAGSQQIVLGRYLPDAASAEAEIIVTGTQNGKQVRYRTAVSLEEAAAQARRASEQSQADEHSFIPRLWARMHLDALLEQGQTQVIQDDIIALSEEYQIMTPYTSFLVLESDADRERFKVKRRFQMRDGEKFFAQGRDNANYELAQQQMKRAGIWRINLQRRILNQLATLGRNPAVFRPQAASRYPGLESRGRMSGGFGGGGGERGGEQWGYDVNGSLSLSSLSAAGAIDDFSFAEPSEASFRAKDSGDLSAGEPIDRKEAREDELSVDTLAEGATADSPDQPLDKAAETAPFGDAEEKFSKALYDEDGSLGRLGVSDARGGSRLSLVRDVAGKPESYFFEDGLNGPVAGGLPLGYAGRVNEWYGYNRAPGYYWFQSLVPTVPLSPAPEKPLPAAQAWPAEARAIAESLLRRDELAKAAGVEVNVATDGFDARRGALGSRSFQRLLISPKSWIDRSWSDSSQTALNWANEKERGTISTAFGIGRTRESSPADLTAYGFDIGDYSLRSLERTYSGYKPEVEKQGADRVVIKLKAPTNKEYETRLLIDTERHVLLRVSQFNRGKVTSATAFSDFIQAAGTWWATRVETTDEKERTTTTIKVSVKELDADGVKQEIDKELAGRDKVVFFKQPLPTVRAAKQALADGKAEINDRLILALYQAHTQQWERVTEHVEQLTKLVGDKPGREWLGMAALMMTRRNEELRKQFLAKGRALAEIAAAGKSTNNEYSLAAHLLGQANQVLQGNELLELLDSLKPIYDKLPEYLLGDKLWKTQRVSYLQQVGQQDATFALLKELATKYRFDQSLQSQYVNLLAGRGEYDAAYARLEDLLADAKLELTTGEADSYRSLHVQFLENEGRVDALVAYLEKWTALNPESSTPYQQYLSALQRNDQEKKVDELVEKWLAEGREAVAKEEPVGAPTGARLEAAVNYALGHVGPWWTYRIEEKWIEPLAQTVRVLARHKDHQYAANSIMQHQSFRDTDQAKQLRKELAELLAAEAATLPSERIGQIVGWISNNNPIVEIETWKKIAAALEKRWASEKEIGDRRQLAATLVQIYGGHIGQVELLAFLERQLTQGPAEDRPSHVQQLFDTLLSQTWKQEYENRAYALLKEIGQPSTSEPPESELDEEAKEARRFYTLVAKLDALHRLNDRMVTARYEAVMAAVEHQEKLTRSELAAKKKEAFREARVAVADRLKREREEFGKELAPWLTIERTYFDVRLARNLDDAIGEAWEFVGAKPKQIDVEQPFERLAQVLRGRHLTTLAYLATRKGAKEELAERLLAYYAQGIELSPQSDDVEKLWKGQKFRLLVALDRPQVLEKLLRSWVDPKIADNTWKVSLAYLLAEQAKFGDAIALFEEVEKADELGATEYRALADWYQIQNEREKHERASLAAYTTLGERWLAARLNRLANPWYQGGDNLPTELDPELLKIFTALFRKSEYPQNYIYHLQRLYQATRDFRLVATLADGALGHSALKIYPILENMRSLLGDVRDEATVDQLAEHVREVRKQGKTDVDRRALDLLEAVIERRAAELQNQPDPHVRAAVAALTRANKGQWADGERRLMADLLANFGKIAAKPLAEEQLRRLQELHAGVERGTFDRLYIAHRLANTRWAYEKWDDAISLIEAALAEFRAASAGVLPQSANDALAAYVNFLMSRGQYSRGEQVYFAEIKTAPNTQQRHWLLQQLYALYTGAVSADGRVSLGKGQTLYKAAEAKMLADLDTPDHNHRYQVIGQLCSLYRAAHQKKLNGVADDIRAIAFKRLPEVLKRQTNNYQYVVSNVASTLHDVAGARDGLTFLIERIEHEPRWLRYQNQDGWSQHSYYLAEWRTQVKDLGDLEPRLLKIVTDELRRDLASRQSRNRNMYVKHTTHFWSEKEDAFALTAEEVLEKNMKSSATIAYIADYLWGGLRHQSRAIDILLAAHERKVLDENVQGQLINYLHEVGRFAESIAILMPLVERRPENMTYRVQLMHAYFRTDKRDKVLALLKETDEFFHEKKLWNESNIAALGQSTLANQLFEQSVAYYKEAIGMRERSAPNRGVGDDTLSTYYMGLAQAHAGLKQTPEAVEAAGAAIVAWGPRHARRAEALAALKDVLAKSPDLDGFVNKLDAQVAETGLENAIVRKSVGSVYLDRGDAKKAIAQLKKAAEVQPNDAETHQMLVSAFDRAGDKLGAIEQLFASVQLSRRNIQLYKDLAQRYAAVGDAKQAERAYSTIVEVLPNESESHAMLAELREQQRRWSDAAAHWKRVAEIRKLEPTGLIKLASAQIQLKHWDDAQQTVRTLEKRDWPSRFGDVQNQIRQLAQQLNASRT